MHEEIQGLWFCPSPEVPGELDYYHFDTSGKVVTFTPLPPELGLGRQLMAIAYRTEPEGETGFRLRLRSQDSWQHMQYHLVSGLLTIYDDRGHEWKFSQVPETEIPPWFEERLTEEHRKLEERL
ncbi:hypothetical protein WJU23_22290 [Prosthecobacter sp. SYSU 5D2]|uniref:hypothetical protein n=1 Tax=Prosthecobacter sp. SYSU 5D2 TaxID=3134134 RepID=UPI0031FE5DB6